MNALELNQIFQKVDANRKPEPILVKPPVPANMLHTPRIAGDGLQSRNRNDEFYEDVGDVLAGIRPRFTNAAPMKKRDIEKSIGEMETAYSDGIDSDPDMRQWERTQKLGLFN
jgi:hypothetical protein